MQRRIFDTVRSRQLRAALAQRVTLPTERWRSIMERVPRHVLIPRFLQREASGQWRPVTADDPPYWEVVYADQPLVTRLADGVPLSTSIRPSLMITMLRALDVRQLNTVLEVGTGPGYMAALLAQRLGDLLVTTVDLDPQVTDQTVERLDYAGYRPSVHTGDGRYGVPGRGPYDRIIASCGFPSVPWAWIEQAAEGAVIVVPIGSGVARLIVHQGQAEGRFLPGGASFMPCRSSRPRTRPPVIDQLIPRPQISMVAPATALERIAFPLSVAAAGFQSCVWPSESGGEIEALGIWTPDGSVAHAGADGTVWEAGPRRLWSLVERLNCLFPDAPDRQGFGITVSPGGQRVWHAARNGPGWDLPQP